MTDYIHGGTDRVEVERLERQAGFASRFILRDFRVSAGERVLDLATGVGAMAGELARRYPGVRLIAVDLKASQLAIANERHPVAAYVQGDGAHLPFREGAFDQVHCSWMLEHVHNPLDVLREVRRVLRAGGGCLFTEVDNASFRTEPAYPEVIASMDALNAAQIASGGDPFVGRKLEALFAEAGFSRVEVQPTPLLGSVEDVTFYREFVAEFAEIFESLDEALGPAMAPTLHAAAARLRQLPDLPGSRMLYRSFIGRAWR
jgi:ubiquinone/menaquinone biosynthesis C-methylase UbiE